MDADEFKAAWERIDNPADIRAAFEQDQIAEDELARGVAYVRNDGTQVMKDGTWIVAERDDDAKEQA